MSLADCIRKAGKALSSKDATAIQTLADDFEASGMTRQEAEQKAIEQHVGVLQGEIDAMLPNDLELAQKQGYEGQDKQEASRWARAVAKGLDVSPEARKQRAVDQGYDVDTKLYHGTDAVLDSLSPDAGFKKTERTGVFLTNDPEIANTYSGVTTEDANIIPVYAKLKNVIVFDAKGANWNQLSLQHDTHTLFNSLRTTDMTARYARTLGYNGVVIKNVTDIGPKHSELNKVKSRDEMKEVGKPSTITVVFNPSQVRSVHAVFDPDETASGDLLAQSAIQTESLEFKNWFGDSKVVDAEGKPMVMYHGTAGDFDTFIASEGGASGPGIYLADKDTASRYASYHGEGANVMPVYVRIENPRDRATGNTKKGGYDGIIRRYDGQITTVVALDPTQIKSAIGNKGTFDPNDPNILNQAEGNLPRGTTLMNPDAPVISLSTASDMSTFLHETMHLFMLMEQQFAKEFGVTDNQRALLESVGVESFDQLTRLHHEQLAESFEVYLREGKAPSVKLMDAFNTFRAWLIQVYQSITQLPNNKLDDKMRAAFDRLLATEQEIQQAAASPAFMQMFRTKEQAGMTDAEWKTYQEAKAKRDGRAVTTIEQKIINQMKQRKTKEWKQERDVLAKEELARLSELPVYKILAGTLKRTDDDMARPMDRESIKVLLGVKNVTGAWIRRTSNDGTDPQLVSEAYGYATVEDMVQEMNDALPIQEAATEAAEARMKEKYGDILNDGTMEAEVMTALHNVKDVDKLYAELRALDSTQTLNRDLLKAEARRIIGTMKNSEIRPSKFHQNMIRAAQRAATSGSKAEKVMAKQQQLVNHYLYKEAVKAKQEADKFTKYVNKVKTRKYNTRHVHPDYVHAMKMLANLYTAQSETTDADIKELIDFFMAQEEAMTGVALLDPQLTAAVTAAKEGAIEPIMMKDMTMAELRGLYLQLKNLRFVGGRESEALAELRRERTTALTDSVNEHGGKLSSDRITVVKDSVANMVSNDPKLKQIEKQVDALVKDIIKNGGTASPEAVAAFDKAAAKVGVPATDVVGAITGFATTGPAKGSKAQGDETTSGVKSLLETLPSLRNFMRWLDGGNEYGEAFKQIYLTVEDALNNKWKMSSKLYKLFESELSQIDQVSLKRYGAKKIALDDGRVVRVHGEERFMTALYWGTESSREAIRRGHKYTDADVMRIMSGMTKPELELLNAIWKMNESIWPDAAKAHRDRTGVVPEKLEATPFAVNGVELTGGHMRIYYRDDGTSPDVFNELGDGKFESLVTSVSGTMIERVGSDGKPVLLDKGNITRALNDIIHYTAFANPSIELAGIMNDEAFQSAVKEKHGVEFWNGMIETMRSTVTGRKDRDMYAALATVVRFLRRNLTAMHLMYSFRNVVQQVTSLSPAMEEVGPVNFINAATSFMVPGNKQAEFINKHSQFMNNRSQLVNREAHEQLHNIAFGGPFSRASKKLNDYGFAMQTMTDSLVAFPLWQAKYEAEMEKHGDHRIAVSQSDTAVAESVGSGSDLHLGAAYQTTRTEAVKGLTQFGSFFNAVVYQRYTRAKIRTARGVKGGRWELLMAVAAQPIIIGTLSAVVTADIPEDEESWTKWFFDKWGSQLAGVYPIIREIYATFQGFNKRGIIQGASSAPTMIVDNIEDVFTDDDILDDTAGLMRAAATLVPLQGAGQVARVLDYMDSDDQNLYEGVVEGKQRNE